MPYSPTSFTAGTPVVAATIEDALADLRLYVNRGIVDSDFDTDTVATEDVLEGDPVGATRTDYWAVSGDVHAIQSDGSRVNRHYVTGTCTTEADYTATYPLEQSMPGCSKSIYVERAATIVVTVWAMVIAGESHLSLNTISPESVVSLSSTDLGTISYGRAYLFVEDAAAAATNAGPQPAGSAMNRRPYSFTFLEVVSPGTHVYQLIVDLHSEKAFVSARSMTIEVLYL